jgi:transcriptional regulator with XRE-family HTH domain
MALLAPKIDKQHEDKAVSTGIAADTALIGPTIRRHLLGTELRHYRQANALRLQDVAATLDVAPSTVSRIETGKAPTRTSFVSTMLDLYKVDDPEQRRLLIDLAREGQRKGWWTKYEDLLPAQMGGYLGLETAAAQIRIFALQAIPDLLQTSGYADAACKATRGRRNPSQISALVDITLRRQEILHDGKHQLHVIIDESALLRSIAPAPDMAAQLNYLLAASTQPTATLQVTRLTCSEPVLCEPFALLTFGNYGDNDVACGSNAYGEIIMSKRPAHIQAMRDNFALLSRTAMTADQSAHLLGELARHPGAFQ